MTKLFTLLIFTFLLLSETYSQQGWVQTSGTPIGGGVTSLLVRENGNILATVSSYNWPGVAGGIRKSTDEGTTWQNVASAYTSRTIEPAFNGDIYASIWFYPQNEGLYRSTDEGDSWQGPIYSVPSGDNIFSIVVKSGSPDYSIFAGTRNGVIRSTDSGNSFQSANNGIPANSWVRDLAIDSSGIIAAATTNGLFTSTDNGDSWIEASGSGSDTIVTLCFLNDVSTDMSGSVLMSGSQNGHLYVSNDDQFYLNLVIVTTFANLSAEEAGFFNAMIGILNHRKIISVSYPPGSNGGGTQSSTDNGQTWEVDNSGLPPNPKTSAINGRVIENRSNPNGSADIQVYVGLFENTSNGARIYKRDYVVGVEQISSSVPEKYELSQNYPNPFNPSTTISFSIPEETFVKLEIFNSIGERVSTLVSEELETGNYKYTWNAKNLTSGIYLYRLQTKDFTKSNKMILMK